MKWLAQRGPAFLFHPLPAFVTRPLVLPASDHLMHDMLSCKQLALIILLPVLIALLIQLFSSSDTKSRVELIIGILSSRYNFIQRETIRRTWLNRTGSQNVFKIKSVFVVGDDDCEIPAEDRISVFGCDMLLFNASLVSMPDLRLFRSTGSSMETMNCAPFRGVSFQVTVAPNPSESLSCLMQFQSGDG